MAPLLSTEELLDRSLEVFATHGYEGTSVRSICRHLEVSHNLVHERYGSKERLWYAAVDHGFQRLAAELAAAAASAEPDPLARLRAILHRYVEVTAEQPALIRLINHEAARPGPRLDHLHRRYLQPAHELADAALRAAEEEGRARRVPAATLHFLIGHGAGGLVSLPGLTERFDDGDPSPVEQARAAVDLVLQALTVP